MSNLVYRDAKGNALVKTTHKYQHYLSQLSMTKDLMCFKWLNHIDIGIEDLRRTEKKIISEAMLRAIPLIGDE